MDIQEIINQTIDEIIDELKKCSLVNEELPQDEEDFIGTSNVSTATWREDKNE
jgi:hypothetical protein